MRHIAWRPDPTDHDFRTPAPAALTTVPIALPRRPDFSRAALNAPPRLLDTPEMGGFRKIKPALYLVMACASLYSATRIIEPILALKEHGLGPASAAGMLQGIVGSKVKDKLAEQWPEGTSLPDLSALLNGAGITPSSANANPEEPREIVVRDVRFADSVPRADRELFTQAMQLQSKGQLDEAAGLYLQILESDPDDTGVHRNLAVLYCQQQRYAQSWKHVHQLRDLGREMPEGFLKVLVAAMPDPG